MFFQTIQQKLHEIHSGFHCDLIRACSYTNGLKLHMVFTNWKEKFLLYGDLCSNLPVAQRTIETVAAKSKQVAEVLEVKPPIPAFICWSSFHQRKRLICRTVNARLVAVHFSWKIYWLCRCSVYSNIPSCWRSCANILLRWSSLIHSLLSPCFHRVYYLIVSHSIPPDARWVPGRLQCPRSHARCGRLHQRSQKRQWNAANYHWCSGKR